MDIRGKSVLILGGYGLVEQPPRDRLPHQAVAAQDQDALAADVHRSGSIGRAAKTQAADRREVVVRSAVNRTNESGARRRAAAAQRWGVSGGELTPGAVEREFPP